MADVSSCAVILISICFALIMTCLASSWVSSPRHAMRDFRRCFRLRRSQVQFRLKTLLLAFAAIQICVAIVTWRGQHGESL